MQTVDSDSRPVPEAPGKLPELPRAAAAAPIELPRVVMRGALAVAALGLLLALLLGLWRARADMRDEIDGAVALAQAMALLAEHGRAADRPLAHWSRIRWASPTSIHCSTNCCSSAFSTRNAFRCLISTSTSA